jgi:DNA-damage-inducible protein D
MEEDRRLLLREELRTHNLRLAETAKTAGVVEPVDDAIFQNHGYRGLSPGEQSQEAGEKTG